MVGPRLHVEQIQETLVLLQEDTDLVEERNKSGGDSCIICSLTRPKESIERPQYLLVNEKRLRRAGKDFS